MMWLLLIVAGLSLAILGLSLLLSHLLALFGGAMGGLKHGSRPVNPSSTRTMPTRLLIICLCLIGSGSFSGCASTPIGSGPSKGVPATDQIKAVQVDVKAALSQINTGLKLVEDMQAGKTPLTIVNLGPIHEAMAQAKTPLESATTALPSAASAAETDATARAKAEAEVIAAKQSDPQRKVIRGVGYGGLFLGLAAVLAGFFVPALFSLIWIRTAGAGLVVFGLLALTIEYYLTEIRWVFLGLLASAVVAAAFWLWTHRTAIAAKIKDDAKYVPKVGPSTPP